MNKILLVCSFTVFCSCTQQRATTESQPVKSDNDGIDSIGDNTSEAMSPVSETETIDYDSTIFIGFVNYFPETNEFYTSLYYRADGVDDQQWNSLLDSTIYQTDEERRRRMPMAEARKLLLLENLDSLLIYNSDHNLVTNAKLVRVERFDQLIESSFIAVYKGDGIPQNNSEVYYGISKPANNHWRNAFEVHGITDEKINEAIAYHAGIDVSSSDFTHYAVSPDDMVLSVVNSSDASYITEYAGDTVTILYALHDDTFFTNIFPTPLLFNGKPVILVSAGVREGDMMWTYPAVYVDSAYIPATYDRVKLE